MVVFPTAEQVDVFANELGGITITQQDAMGGDPAIVFIPAGYVNMVIRAFRVARNQLSSNA